MKKALKVTFGTMLAASTIASVSAHQGDFLNRSAIYAVGSYTQSTNNGLSMGEQSLGALPAGGVDTIATSAKFIKMHDEADYGLGFTHRIPNTHTRFFLHYDHFSDHKNDSFVGGSSIRNIGVLGVVDAASGHVEHHFNEFRVGFNHTLTRNRRFHFNVGGFFEYDKLRRGFHEDVLFGGVSSTRDTDQQTKGWGPGVAFMARAIPSRCYPHWGVFVGTATSLIYTDNEFEQAFRSPALSYFYAPEESHSLVGKLDVSFGIDYARVLRCDMGRMLVDFSLGMRYMNMFNALKNGNVANNPFPVGGNFSANLGAPNDWGRVGPFIKFKIGGAHA